MARHSINMSNSSYDDRTGGPIHKRIPVDDTFERLVCDTLSRRYVPRAVAAGNVRFQLTRGELGISL